MGFCEKSNCIKDSVYIDDGYSGSNFDRPEFKRMMAGIEAGDINCVIVKDLSRLGRDYIEAGRLIQKTFPALHVRFIAVTDHFDSKTADGHTKTLVLPVKNFINDSYCRDISQKVKSQQKIKREQGKFIGAFAVYGYRRMPQDKNRLCPDDYAADIVRKIFMWRLEGMSSHGIARRLNASGVLSPMEYKRSRGEKFSTSFQTNITAKWSAAAVQRILTNEIYTGVMVQGRREQVSYKVKKTKTKPENEWVRVEGTHEAVVSRADFEQVRALMQVPARAKTGETCAHLFSGLLYCGDCGKPMTRRVNGRKGAAKVCFICSSRNKGEGCTRHSISEQELRQAVLQVLQVQTAVFWDADSQMEYLQNTEVHFGEADRADKEIARLLAEQEKYMKLRAGLYEDFKTGLLTETDYENFQAIYEKQYEEAKGAVEKQKEMLRQIFRNGVESGVKLEKLRERMQITELSRDALLCFINRIEVYEDKRIYVKFRWKFRWEF